MKLVVGLGNYGERYRNTRHNIGFAVVDAFVLATGSFSWKRERTLSAFLTKIPHPEAPWIFMKSDGFINLSGTPVTRVAHFFKIPPTDVIVVCDEITLPLGTVKITNRPGTAGHNGVHDILTKLGPGFTRFRIGIGAKPHPQMDLADYVLSTFTPDELTYLTAHLNEICLDLKLLLDKGPVTAMNSVNRKLCRQDPIELP